MPLRRTERKRLTEYEILWLPFNFQICVGLGRLTVEGRKGLFAGEHFDGEETLRFGQGEGIILVEGQPLRGIVIPTVSKKKLLVLLQK